MSDLPTGLKSIKQFGWKDLISGFVVSLIAMPLALGLATASGVPPMSGIISAVVGGIIVAFLGGTHVTISGPGNGLVVVILTSVIALGKGDLFQGYLLTMAACFVAGLIITLLGFARLGNLSDFFPSATIQGMLSAIGLIIIAKQIHVMLGESGVEAANNLMLLVETPQSFYNLLQSDTIPWVGIIGIFSLVIMASYAKIENKILQAIPAPMWIVLVAIGFFYYFKVFSSENYPIDTAYLIQIPENISDSIVFPNFSRLLDKDSIIAIISITLIASIESLLSIKAVDKLDVYKRRSNVNKELKALGLATSISALLGGLPVVAVIARSSVNVNQGAVTKTANFFHAFFVCLFIVLFSTLLNKIPLSALAGILVFTGYKLASPSHFKRMYQFGKDQFAIYLITLVATLLFGLINGILIGIGVTFLIQFFLMEDKLEFLKKPFRPNNLMYEENDGKMHLSVKGHSSFLNYLSLKYQIDSIPPNKHLILDFSLTSFVDNSVMEHIHHYRDEFRKKNSVLEVVGLDIHDPTSPHPFAARRLLKIVSIMEKGGILTNRQRKLKEFAKEIGWKFKSNSVFGISMFDDFPFFRTKSIDHAFNIFKGIYKTYKVQLMDVEFSEGEFTAKETHKHTVFIINFEKSIPTFRLDKERIFDRLAGIAGFNAINIEGHEDFSHRFLLKGKNQEEIKRFFTDDLVLFFESHPYYHLESDGKRILILKGQRLSTISEVKALASFGKELIDKLH